MSALRATHRTGAFAAMLVPLVLGTSFALAAPAGGAAAGKTTNASVAAVSPAAPASSRVSPHARAARQRAAAQAAAQAEAGPSGVRVSAFTMRRKPHSHMAGVR